MTALETFTTASKQPLTTGRRPDMTAICAKRPPAKACRLGFDPSAGRKAGMNRLLRSERRAGSLRAQPAIASPSRQMDNNKPPSLAAARKRLYRQRRRRGFICTTITVHEGQVGELVYQGLLPEDQRSDPAALARAVESVLYDRLMPKNAIALQLRSQTGRVPKAK